MQKAKKSRCPAGAWLLAASLALGAPLAAQEPGALPGVLAPDAPALEAPAQAAPAPTPAPVPAPAPALEAPVQAAPAQAAPVQASPQTAQRPHPADWLGVSVAALLAARGAPASVYAVRGVEPWQDDVVFVYPDADFYLYKDRVWQVGVSAAADFRRGDDRRVALLALGDAARDGGDHIVSAVEGFPWPVELRCNVDEAGKITVIFFYRPDF